MHCHKAVAGLSRLSAFLVRRLVSFHSVSASRAPSSVRPHEKAAARTKNTPSPRISCHSAPRASSLSRTVTKLIIPLAVRAPCAIMAAQQHERNRVMHTIYFQNAPVRTVKGKARNAPVQVLGHAPTPEIAEAHLRKMGKTWLASKPGRKVIHSGVEARFLYSDGKLAAVADFDPIPAVAEEPDAQPRRGKGVKA